MGKLAKVEGDIWRGSLKVKGTSRVPSDREYDMWKSCDMGVTVSDTAEVYGVEESTVRAAIKKTENFFTSTVSVDVAALKIRQHARLEALLETAVSDYQESGGKTVTVVRKQIPGMEGSDDVVIQETITEKHQSKNPQFLNVAMKAMEDQRKIWPGANAPSAKAVTNADGTGNPKIDVSVIAKNMTEEEIKALEMLEKIYEKHENIIDIDE